MFKNTSTTGADRYRFLALITMMAVKLQMFGGETCQVHVKVDQFSPVLGQTGIIGYKYILCLWAPNVNFWKVSVRKTI